MTFKGDIEKDGLISSIFTPKIVGIKLEKLNVNKCPGLDGIHPKMFELRKELAQPLSKLYSASLNCGVVPADW